jgi:hypothetical protein
VNRQQLIYITAAVTAVFLLFYFGRTSGHSKKPLGKPQQEQTGQTTELSFETMLGLAKKRLTAAQLQKVTEWENSVVRGDVKYQQVKVYKQLSSFWMDSVGAFVPYVKYMGEAAKLENSDKNLTFAAHLLLRELQTVEEQPLKVWMAKEAKQLFEKALELNPVNDSTKIGLGSTYFFGGAGAEPPMRGIGLIREVAEKNPGNAYAQYMLGVGATVSGQWSKAIERFAKVVELEPANLEVMLRLADAYEQSGDKAGAKKVYQQFLLKVKEMEARKQFRSNPGMIKQIEEHIKTL